EHRVAEPEHEQVLHRLLAEIVVDAKHTSLGNDRVQRPVELTRGLEVAPEGLLDDERGAVRKLTLAQSGDEVGEGRGRDGEVPDAAFLGELRSQRSEVPTLDRNEAQAIGEARESGGGNAC